MQHITYFKPQAINNSRSRNYMSINNTKYIALMCRIFILKGKKLSTLREYANRMEGQGIAHFSPFVLHNECVFNVSKLAVLEDQKVALLSNLQKEFIRSHYIKDVEFAYSIVNNSGNYIKQASTHNHKRITSCTC